jgi:hypothetical protein
MSADGVSLPTTIAQLGNAARSQAKGQQTQQPATPLSEQLEQTRDLKVRRVKQTEPAEKGRVQPDEERRKRGRKRKDPRRPQDGAAPSTEAESDEAVEGAEPTAEQQGAADYPIVGRNVDARA